MFNKLFILFRLNAIFVVFGIMPTVSELAQLEYLQLTNTIVHDVLLCVVQAF